MHPDIKQFVKHYPIEFDDDLCALSTLLQWIWRSQIRVGKPINIYIPNIIIYIVMELVKRN